MQFWEFQSELTGSIGTFAIVQLFVSLSEERSHYARVVGADSP